jgi:hypothetical protein
LKFGLLKYSRSRNFGDQVQSLAANAYLPKVDEYLDRDYLNEYKSEEPIKLIMNGWWMARPENWPPVGTIDPLFVSFHITHDYNTKERIFTAKAIDYFKDHEPIGCRDYYTLDLLKAHGIKGYYTGCLTLTLDRTKFTNKVNRSEKIYLVDVLYKVEQSKLKFLNNFKRKWVIRQLFPKGLLEKAEFITQVVPKRTSEEEKFIIAKRALEKYADAGLVITSRIHCALPCTAFGTKVLFIDGALDEFTDTTRLNGIQEYFNLFKVSEVINSYRGFLIELFAKNEFKNPLNIDWNNLPENPGNHHNVASNLSKTCSAFIK